MPEIAIIVPVYNMQHYLRTCMDSLVGQTFRDIEIICVDDGSTDSSPEILAEYAAADARIRVLTQENRGLSAARNAGLTAAKAPLIMFCDSDDWYAPTMCERMHAAMQGGADMAVCGVREVKDTGRTRSGKYYDLPTEGEVDVDDTVLMRCNVCSPNKIHRRSIIDRGDLRFPEGLRFEDEFFFSAYTAYVHRVAFIHEKLYFYRQRMEGITGRVTVGRANYTGDYCSIANCIWLYHAERDLVASRLPYLSHTWLRLCSAGLTLCATAEACASMEDRMIAFARAHLLPCTDWPPAARQRLNLLTEHRWVGLHRHARGLLLSRGRDRISPDVCFLKRRYYLMGIPCWETRKKYPTNGK